MFETRDALVTLDRDDNEIETLFDGAEELESFLRAQRAAVVVVAPVLGVEVEEDGVLACV